jgi:hypothetical protein
MRATACRLGNRIGEMSVRSDAGAAAACPDAAGTPLTTATRSVALILRARVDLGRSTAPRSPMERPYADRVSRRFVTR